MHEHPSGPTDVRVEPFDHRDPAWATRLHAVMTLAYAQEARLLGVRDFAPLQRSVSDLQAGSEFHLGAFSGDDLLAALSIGADDEPGQLLICALVVHPRAQRQGLGRRLVREALQRGQGMAFAVSTGAANAPALALYRSLGFVAYRHGRLGPEALAMVKLRRAPAPLPDVPGGAHSMSGSTSVRKAPRASS